MHLPNCDWSGSAQTHFATSLVATCGKTFGKRYGMTFRKTIFGEFQLIPHRLLHPVVVLGIPAVFMDLPSTVNEPHGGDNASKAHLSWPVNFKSSQHRFPSPFPIPVSPTVSDLPSFSASPAVIGLTSQLWFLLTPGDLVIEVFRSPR